jgi:hypothetical protein
MGKLAEGARVFDAVFDAETDFQDWNDLQDQLLGMLGPLNMPIPMIGGMPGTGWSALSTTWEYYEAPTLDPPWWSIAGVVIDTTQKATLNFPVPWIRSGMKITRMYALTWGDSVAGDDDDGSILLVRNRLVTAGAPVAQATAVTISTQPWRTSAYQLLDSGAVAHVVDGTYDYRLQVRSALDAAARTYRLLGAYATVQFGN